MKQLFLFILLFFQLGAPLAQRTRIDVNRFLSVKGNKYGVTDSFNKTVVPFQYDYTDLENNRLVVRKNGLAGLLTINNEMILPVAYRFILPRGKGRFILWTPKSLFGLCDNNGTIILPVQYQQVSSTQHDDFYIARNEKNLSGVYSFTGKTILPELYKFYTLDGYKIFAQKEEQPLIIDLLQPGNPVLLDKEIAFVETAVHLAMGEQFFQIIKKGNRYGVINSSNQTVIPVIYDKVKSAQHWRYFIVRKNGKVGLVTVDGTVVKEPIYDDIQLQKEYVVLKRKGWDNEYYPYQW